MNIQRYLLPASMAAAFHAAVFYGFPPGPAPLRCPPPTGPGADPVVEIPVDLAGPVPPDPSSKERNVSPRRGDARPEIPPPPLPDRSPTVFPLPTETPWKAKTPVEILRVGPPGNPEGTPNGIWGPAAPVPGIDTLDRIPRTLAQLPPDYPAALKRDRIEGTVLVEFVVDVSGRVRSARVINCSHPEFAAPTVRAVMHWRFEPGRRNGLLVPFRMAVPVNYHLESN